MSGWVSSTGWNINLAAPGPIGSTTPSSGAFTTLSASSTVSGTGFSTYLASPPAIGGTAAAAGSFTTLNASSNVTLSGGTANGVVYLNGSKNAASGSALVFDGANLGIGSTTPSTNLNAVKNVGATITYPAYLDNNAGGSGTGSRIGFRNSNNSYASLGFVYDAEGFSAELDSDNSAAIRLKITNSEKIRIDSNGNMLVGTKISPTGSQTSSNVIVNGVISTISYTVATLPTGMPKGSRAYVTDALAPTILATVVGGGAVVVPVFYNGSAWIVG